MAKAKFEKLNSINENSTTKTHADLQTKKVGRPVGSKTKSETSNDSITIALTPTQKRELEEYAKNEYRSVGSVIKMLLIKNGIIQRNE